MKNEFYNILVKKFIKTVTEGLIKRPEVFAQFKECEVITNKVESYLVSVAKKATEQLNNVWCKNCDINLFLKELDLNIVFEREPTEKETLAAFDPTVKPFTLYINFYQFNNKNLEKNSLIDYFTSIYFKTLLSHELMHYIQAHTYSYEEMMKNVEVQTNLENYQTSPIELEACIFMVLWYAKTLNKEIKNVDDLFDYLETLNVMFLNNAKSFILTNKESVKDIFKNNQSFFKENYEKFNEQDEDFVITPCISKHSQWHVYKIK